MGRAPLLIVLAVVLASCSEHGFYYKQAQDECRGRGLAPDTPAFDRCVTDVEQHVYIWVDRSGE